MSTYNIESLSTEICKNKSDEDGATGTTELWFIKMM